jgi:putative hydrolase of the HAD superfamily
VTKGPHDRGPSVASGGGPRFAAVFFDSGDTLMRPRLGRWWPKPGFGELLAGLSGHPAVDADLRQVEAAGTRYLAAAAPATTLDEERRLYVGYYRLVLPLVLDPVPDGLDEALADAAVYELDQQPFDECQQALAQLAQAGYRLGIVSNAGPSLERRYHDLGLHDRFDPFVVSSVVGSEKPDRAIYQRALEAAGLEARQVAFVDDVARNVHAANELGMFGVLVQRDGTAPPSDLSTVTDLRQLPELLAEAEAARWCEPHDTVGAKGAGDLASRAAVPGGST